MTQRPQHLMKRFAQHQPVFFWEEHIPCDHPLPYLEQHPFAADGIITLRPRLPHWWNAEQVEAGLRELLDMFVATSVRATPLLWFYTPMMLSLAEHLGAAAVIYDCMDELSAFRFADPALLEREARLLARADLVFTGGYSLYEAKRSRHRDVHAFPSAVEVAHFAQARAGATEPDDQRDIGAPKLGFFGVIDERIDLALLDAVATARPDWSFLMIGPVVKIDAAHLPRRPNIHWLGSRHYGELPAYLSGWDVALMPFAINAATRFISPTKTPEYLAGGLPVVSTPVVDVVRHYGDLAAVTIAADATAFVAACVDALALPRDGAWRDEADRLLATQSWDRTQTAMADEIDRVLRTKQSCAPAAKRERYDTLVVGAGFAGAVLAERLAADSGQRVLVVDRRPHIGGNAYDEHDAAGVLVHRYGPHIFHTNSAAAFLASRAEPVGDIRTSEDVVVSAVGRKLYETFFQGYTRKQWGLDPSELDRAVTARVPTRTSTDDRYFTDTFQAMPANGYTRMFEAMLDHPGITVELGVEYRDVIERVDVDHIVFTGPIDEYFDFRFGKLPYRSLQFRHETHDVAQYQPVAVVNYPDEAVPQTRITEYKHLTGQLHAKTSISYEFPSAEGDPYYPIPRPENQALFKRYEALADAEPGVTFVGRLATYRYYNMDQVVGQALATYRRMSASPAAVAAPVLAAE